MSNHNIPTSSPEVLFPYWRSVAVVGIAAVSLAACDKGEATSTPSTTSESSMTIEQSIPVSSSDIPSGATSVAIESPATSASTPETTATAETQPATLAEKYTISIEDKDPSKFGPKFCEAINNWMSEGFTSTTLEEQKHNTSHDPFDIADSVIKDSDKEIIKALFDDNIDQGTQNYIDDLVKIHRDTVAYKIMTGYGIEFALDDEIYGRNVTCSETTLTAGTYQMTVHDQDNGDKNRIGKDTGGAYDKLKTFDVTTVENPATSALDITKISVADATK